MYLVNEDGKHHIVKERLPKKYRHPILDVRINTARVKSEVKILEKAFKCGIKVPKVIKVLPEENKILMEYIPGTKLKDYINEHPDKITELLTQLGQILQKLHGISIIHGDLTTSNMIFQDGEIYLLDFGLGALTATVEDKAVDLYLFEKAFIATHPQLEEKFSRVIEEYA